MKEKTKYQTKCRLKKGDEVIITTGRDKGQSGKIDKVDLKKDRIFIAGLNIYKRHTKPSMAEQEGGIQEKAMSVHLSNVALLDPKKKKATRIGYKAEGDQKVRYAKLSGSII